MTRPVAIVTGSSSGAGAATVELFAARGYDVVINFSRDATRADQVAQRCTKLGAAAEVIQADIAEDADCQRLAAAVRQRWGFADALVNSAGTTKFVANKKLDGLTAEDFTRIYAVNVVGAFQMARAVAPLMAGRPNAAIVNISSIASFKGLGSSIAYACSKGALNTLTLSLAHALAPNIRVNAVLPGMIDGPWLREGLGAEGFASAEQRYKSRAISAQVLAPEDVASAAFWLCHDALKVNGQLLPVDAGYLLG